MADFADALRAQLLADAGVASASGGRVTWGSRPQGGALPALVLVAVGGARDATLDGSADWGRTAVQADAYATTHVAAWTLIEAALAVAAVPFTRGGVRVASAGRTAPRFLPDTGADGATLVRLSADLTFWHD